MLNPKKVLLAIVMVSLILSVVLTFQTAGATWGTDREKIGKIMHDTAKELGDQFTYYDQMDDSWPIVCKGQKGRVYFNEFTLLHKDERYGGKCGVEYIDDIIRINAITGRSPGLTGEAEELSMELFEGDYLASEKPPWCYRRFPEVEFLSCEKTQFNGYPAFYSEDIRKSRGYERRGCGTVYDTYCSFRVE